jgi:hypothetical protein
MHAKQEVACCERPRQTSVIQDPSEHCRDFALDFRQALLVLRVLAVQIVARALTFDWRALDKPTALQIEEINASFGSLEIPQIEARNEMVILVVRHDYANLAVFALWSNSPLIYYVLTGEHRHTAPRWRNQ